MKSSVWSGTVGCRGKACVCVCVSVVSCSVCDRAVWRKAVQLLSAQRGAVALVSLHRPGRAAVGTGNIRGTQPTGHAPVSSERTVHLNSILCLDLLFQ